MKEVFTMWRHTQMVVLVALSAAIYAAVLIPFLIVIVVGAFMLGGREQVEAAEELLAGEGEESRA